MDLEKTIKNPVELEYFKGLLNKKDEGRSILKIHTTCSPSGIYPTAIAPQDILEQLPYRKYEDIKKQYSSKEKSKASLWLRKMHGGIGSSIDRVEYLKEFGRNKVGAKGTDLYIKTKDGHISIAEAQLLQASKKTASFEKVIFQDILNEDVVEFFDDVWKKHADLFKTSKLEHFKTLVQSKLPTLDGQKQLTTKRVAPAGHGLFGYEILHAIFTPELRPAEKNLICSIGNGEDLSSTPDKAIANWMLAEKVPVCMITTTKTRNDVKGGQIALADRGEEGIFLTIIEKSQAENAGQLGLFTKLGLRDCDNEAFFNTNMVLLNIDVLIEKFKTTNKEELLKASLPDLIQNKKEQDGETFTQLEGAMGSVFLNLDTYWRKTFGEPLVHIMNVSKENRTRFFSPIKSAFDYFMQYHSDRFTFNEDTYHLEDNNPGKLPRVDLPSEYKNLARVMEDFKDTKLLNLESIDIPCPHNFAGQNLTGNIN
jgi:hypothetical protein